MSRPPRTAILSAPRGWGKTSRAQELMQYYGCGTVVDNWAPGQPIKPGALHLTNTPWRDIPRDVGCAIFGRGWST